MGEERSLTVQSGVALRRSKYQELAPMYARLAQLLAADLVRLKGMTPEEAEVVAVQMALDQARDTLVGMEAMDER